MSSSPSLYEPLDVIGNGSFGIIRKVRRRADGLIFARKELNFERMTERDRKQIVAEVNILKDLHHEHIVRYHDRYVDRDAGVLYILMEYCGGGDLSSTIKLAQRHGRAIPEDTIWNYFMQILLALNHCHHPNGHSRSGSTGNASSGDDGKEKRAQILHRDLKPDNVFLDDNNTVKLGDFGLSKALAQASFANTYVGTPYYMSPELMQEKAYDSKSDIWSLGCLIYELCALKPPFHEAKTHSELSILIRNGRIPPLPKGYSPTLSSTIKAMLNLNPAMRPSAAQLLQHERIDLAFKITETTKMVSAMKVHKANMSAKERELQAREAVLNESEARLTTALSQKDSEIASLRSLLATAESTHQTRVREALLKREEELRSMVLKQEAEVALRMARREEEIMEAVRRREDEIGRMWADWERQIREGMGRAVEERMAWVRERSDELEAERARLDGVREELDRKLQQVEAAHKRSAGTVKAKTPLEEVKNILAPLARLADSPEQQTPTRRSSRLNPPHFETPLNRAAEAPAGFAVPSAMKGVILTDTGEALATPSPAEVAKLFIETPRITLNFAQIFDFDSDAEESADEGEDGRQINTRPLPSKAEEVKVDVEKTPKAAASLNVPAPAVRPTRLRRPSTRASAPRPEVNIPPSASSRSASSSSSTSSSSSSTETTVSKSAGSRESAMTNISNSGAAVAEPVPQYDLSDEENLPSPFIKKVDRDRITRTASVPALAPNSTVAKPAPKNGRKSVSTLRAMAVVNAANAANTAAGKGTIGKASSKTAGGTVRTSIAKAQRASEEARKALFRP